MEEAQAAIQEIADSSTVADTTATLRRRNLWWPMEKTESTAALAERAIELGRRLGLDFTDTSTGGASDANTTSGMGVPTLDGLGPVGGLAHSSEEYLEVDSIVPRTAMFAALLLEIAREGVLR
jgi:glutamate carboxypeptidase